MKIIGITQARTGSKRFPKKVLKKISGKSLLEIHLDRLKKSKNLDNIVVATTELIEDQIIVDLAKKSNVDYYEGSEIDVLDRFLKASLRHKPDYILRVTSDCPLIDPKLVDELISVASKTKLDYVTNTIFDEYPDGQDIEVIKFEVLKYAASKAKLKSEREHVTPFIIKNTDLNGGSLFTGYSYNHNFGKKHTSVRMTVDEYDDFLAVEELIKKFGMSSDC